MKTNMSRIRLPKAWICAAAALALGCGAATPQADSPESDDDDASSSSSSSSNALGTSGGATPTYKADPVVGVTVKDETTTKETPCTGSDFPDLFATISQASCELPAGKGDDGPQDLASRLEVKAASDAPKVAPGGTSTITVTFHNKGQTPLALDFAVDPEPHFDFEVYTPKGKRVDKPAGAEPPLPPEVQSAPEPDKGIARVTLAPGGHAKLTRTWAAVRYKWVSKDEAKGAIPGRGYPREPSGPLPGGKYVLRLIMPLLGVSEGVDHEMTRPRIPIVVGKL